MKRKLVLILIFLFAAKQFEYFLIPNIKYSSLLWITTCASSSNIKTTIRWRNQMPRYFVDVLIFLFVTDFLKTNNKKFWIILKDKTYVLDTCGAVHQLEQNTCMHLANFELTSLLIFLFHILLR